MPSSWMPLTLVALLALSVVPGTAAACADCADADQELAELLTWYVPATSIVGRPVHAAYALVLEDDPLRLRGHVDVPLSVYLDDELIWTSTSIHEHDGFHALTITPHRTGMLHFVAGYSPMAGGDGHDHGAARTHATAPTHAQRGQEPTTAPAGLPPEAITATVAVLPTTGWLDDDAGSRPFARHSWEPAGAGAYLQTNALVDHGYLMDLRDPQGRLLASTFGRSDLDSPLFQHYSQSALPSVLLTPSPLTTVAHAGLLTFGPTSSPSNVPPTPAPSTATAVANACNVADLRILTDPNSLSAQGLVWQQWTDVRVAILPTDPTVAQLGWQEGTAGHTHAYANTPDFPPLPRAADPFAQITFQAGEPGPHQLWVETHTGPDQSVRCAIPYQVVPNPIAAGTVVELIDVHEDMVDVAFRPIDATGAVLPHYEFDTRVYRLGLDQQLVWQGKLHGHEGPVSFHLANLPDGDYRIRTYPSPQDGQGAPVASLEDHGFSYNFVIATQAEPALDDLGDTADAPGPSVLGTLLVFVAALALLWRRR